MRLTEPQHELLHSLRDGPREVRGSSLKVARALQSKGLVLVGVGGSGVAYHAPWWRTAQLTDAGRILENTNKQERS